MPLTRNTIVLVELGGRHGEAQASAALTPGHLLSRLSTGKVAKHAVVGGPNSRYFAKEDALQGRDIDTAYAQDELVSFHQAARGETVNAFLKAGTNYAVGDQLVSAGDGTLQTLASAVTALRTSTDGVAAAAAANLANLAAEAEKIGDDVRLLLARAGLDVVGEVEVALDLSAGGAVATRTPVRIY